LYEALSTSSGKSPADVTRGEWRPLLAAQVKVKLPNGINAVVDILKLRDYCLNPGHPEGRHKARVFRATLGMEREDAEELRAAILAAARDQDADATETDEYGERYVLDFSLRHAGRETRVRSAWIIRKGEKFPRLASCYLLQGL
jgi:hypothetical protein